MTFSALEVMRESDEGMFWTVAGGADGSRREAVTQFMASIKPVETTEAPDPSKVRSMPQPGGPPVPMQVVLLTRLLRSVLRPVLLPGRAECDADAAPHAQVPRPGLWQGLGFWLLLHCQVRPVLGSCSCTV